MIPWEGSGPCPLFVREGTIDGNTLQACINEDEYKARGHVRPGDIVIDCGAYIGGFTVLVASLGASVHAIEPSLANRLMIEANTASLRGQIHLWEAALVGRLDLPTAILALGEGLYRFMGSTAFGRPGIAVPAIPLYEVLDAELAPEVAMLKMDIEGAEFEVLQSTAHMAAPALAKIRYIAMEVHPRNGELFPDAVAEIAKCLPAHQEIDRAGSLVWWTRR